MDLHSNMFLLRPKKRDELYNSQVEFTFQYVSIKTLPPLAALEVASRFTFQYVSIKTCFLVFCFLVRF